MIYQKLISLVLLTALSVFVSCDKNPFNGGGGTGSWRGTVENPIDPDGNEYTTVLIGNQRWMVENLRTTRYSDGTPIPGPTFTRYEWMGLSTPAYCWYDNTTDEEFRVKYGALYNWWVVDPENEKQIAPAGWRVPTDADWTELQNYLIVNGYNWDGSTTGNKIGKSMASSGGEWHIGSREGSVGNDQGSNNSSGFSALPGGSRYHNGLFDYPRSDNGTWWSATEHDAYYAYRRGLFSNHESLTRYYNSKTRGWSVRLLRD